MNGNETRGDSTLTITLEDDAVIVITSHNMHILTMCEFWQRTAYIRSMNIQPVEKDALPYTYELDEKSVYFVLYRQNGYTTQFMTRVFSEFNAKVVWCNSIGSIEILRSSRVLEGQRAFEATFVKCRNCGEKKQNWTEIDGHAFCLDCINALRQLQNDVTIMRTNI